jgi:hypothetical protein
LVAQMIRGKCWANEVTPVDYYRVKAYALLLLLFCLFWGGVGYLLWVVFGW